LIIFLFYNSTVPYIVEFTSHLLSDEIRILLAVREWEREGMGITNGNEKGIGTKLDLTQWEWAWIVGNGKEWDWNKDSGSSLMIIPGETMLTVSSSHH